jgi:serine/threonine protein phosphatase PrpC
MKVECYAATRPQDGRTTNEDAFLIIREGTPVAAVCDGAGAAEQVAKRVVRLFELWVREATLGQILDPKTWVSWVRNLDSALLGGSQSTFLAVAVAGDQLVGASAGDSQAYLLGAEGGFQYLTPGADKSRLGSGEVKPFTFSVTLKPRDIVLLMSDGAWTPLGPYLIEKTVRPAALQHFSEVPVALLDAAGKTGRWDDMTVIAPASSLANP